MAVIDLLFRLAGPIVFLAALGIVTNWYRWIFQKIGLTPPSEDVVGSSAEILLPKEAKP